MPLPPPRREPRDPRVLVAAAVAFGVLGLITMLVVIGNEVIKGDRPEEEVAAAFLDAVFAGRGEEVYDLTTPAYQAIVFPDDLQQLSRELAAAVGDDVEIEVLGSERTPGTEPQDSFVGYQGSTAVGTVEGVMILLELEEGEWFVLDISYRFPDATDEQIADLLALTERLNQQFAERARSAGG